MFKDHPRPKVLEQSVPSVSAYQKGRSAALPAAETRPDSQSSPAANPGFSLQTERTRSAGGDGSWGFQLCWIGARSPSAAALGAGIFRRSPYPGWFTGTGCARLPDSLRHRLCCSSRFQLPLRQGSLRSFSVTTSPLCSLTSPPHAIGKVQMLDGRINWISEAAVVEWWKGQVKQ